MNIQYYYLQGLIQFKRLKRKFSKPKKKFFKKYTNKDILVIYRISNLNASAPKNKLKFATKEFCLKNFIKNFKPKNMFILADSINKETEKIIKKNKKHHKLLKLNYKSGYKTFIFGLNLAIKSRYKLIYFVEDDFLHLPKSQDFLLEAFNETTADYVTLYDHPDYYKKFYEGGPNPLITENTKSKIYLTKNSHWKSSISTVGTFASKKEILKEDFKIFKKFNKTKYFDDFNIFTYLSSKRHLISKLPGNATHVEINFLGKLINWSKIK